jgi:hypothetical protein
MGLLDKLTTQGGSAYSYGNGTTPAVNPGATQLSKLHADGNQPGYSLDGSDFSTVNAAFQQYNDGVNNILPQPSQLDLNGTTPTQYINNLPQ